MMDILGILAIIVLGSVAFTLGMLAMRVLLNFLDEGY